MELDAKFDCIVIGGGVTGAGICRDLTLRGLSVLLLEKSDLSEGTTGRNHGMLHSGVRYAVKDPEAAIECSKENEILKKIAPHIIDPCGGYFVGITDEDNKYGDKLHLVCQKLGIDHKEISPKEFFKKEPNCNPKIQRVFKVNDAYVDPFLLTIYNALDALQHGAKIQTYCEVTKLLIEKNQVKGVEYYDKLNNKTVKAFAYIIINATGPWAQKIEKGLPIDRKLNITPTKGTLLVINQRLVNSIINRMKPAGNGDIIVPSHQSVLVGTSSIPVSSENLDCLMATSEEIEALLSLGEILIPSLSKYRVIRFFSGARPLISSSGSMREATRKFSIIDYEEEGISGLVTIFGGKMTTYRLMAERVSDLVCQKLGIEEKCQTDTMVLPGGERIVSKKEIQDSFHVSDRIAHDMSLKWGTFTDELVELCLSCLDSNIKSGIPRIICECEKVSEPELLWVRENLGVEVLDDYRRRTRQGMGSCQAQFCAYKIANLEAKWSKKSHSQIMRELKYAMEERWKTQEMADEQLKRQIKLSKYMYYMGGAMEL
ncbi:anaerobic glycerol-3-phosphate dehydrogenase subunit A [Promethearchaeum syntrophicum]|uniref:Anaerobic glycerol-3-phosphate dehydrogenase subunit A n=1 Tax=Promethearchaeum syntrophicum TaxID=2594042 RepID=A0A5B9DFX2_9ARCH|nr:anaerobic glycerol-3-phosphate dehydrogenase subunit A [Candidatus Prometheoarchaeum syntrophicum]QEE18024.1 sn-glycerol-3-phosphate dehydrogenase subunit A [Candidatus Prometheoarchaeum syntrophicum]